MTNAYATIADQGERHWATPLLQVQIDDGEIDPSIMTPGEQVLARTTPTSVTYALQGVVQEGTGTAAATSGCPVAGKTGTGQRETSTRGSAATPCSS